MECRFHRNRAAVILCEKMEYGCSRECPDLCRACTDPSNFCKSRPCCLIWELGGKEAKKTCPKGALGCPRTPSEKSR